VYWYSIYWTPSTGPALGMFEVFGRTGPPILVVRQFWHPLYSVTYLFSTSNEWQHHQSVSVSLTALPVSLFTFLNEVVFTLIKKEATHHCACKQTKTRNSSGDEIANVLSLRRHCTRTKNTLDFCIDSATDRFLQRRFTKFSEITQCIGYYAVQGHPRSPSLVPIESSYAISY